MIRPGDINVFDMKSGQRDTKTSLTQAQRISSCEDANERGKSAIKCRIPRMVSPARPQTPKKPTHTSCFEMARAKVDTGRQKNQQPVHPSELLQSLRQPRPVRAQTLKRPSTFRQLSPSFRHQKTIINIPIGQDSKSHTSSEEQENLISYLDNKQFGDTNQDDPSDTGEKNNIQLKIRWQENIVKFETIKQQLSEQQRELLQTYAILRSYHKEMEDSGEQVYLPPPDDLQFMSIGKMAPGQILQLCGETLRMNSGQEMAPLIDMNALYKVPNKIIATCEENLNSRKEIADWFQGVVAKKIIPTATLVSKINAFMIETDNFKTALNENKEDYSRIFNETGDCIKKNTTLFMENQLQVEHLKTKLEEIKTVNQELQRRLQAMQHSRSTPSKFRLQELERSLKDEKCKNTVLKECLSKANLQVKIKDENILRLNSECVQANAAIQSVENTVVQLREEGRQLQSAYEKKMQNLNESIDTNTSRLEEIMNDREKLLTQKEDLENQLAQLSKHYDEALNNAKYELNCTIGKFIETEKRYYEIAEEKSKLEDEKQSLSNQLRESESRFKELLIKLSKVELTARDVTACNKRKEDEIESLKRELIDSNEELVRVTEAVTNQRENIKELQEQCAKAAELETSLKTDIESKERCIAGLEKQRALLETLLQERESKAELYEVQLSNLKSQICQLPGFEQFEHWKDLYEMIKQQNMQLKEANEQNNIISETLKDKEIVLMQQEETITEHAHLIEERDANVNMLMDKNEEQLGVIQLLRNNLDMKEQTDILLRDQLIEKNTEIENLIANIEKRKLQASELEKIVLILENETLQLRNFKRKARQTISSLEKKLAEYGSYLKKSKISERTGDNLDDLINMLEHELSDSENQFNNNSHDSKALVKHQHRPENNSKKYQPRDNVPTKIVMGNYVKKTYKPNEKLQRDSFERETAIRSIVLSESDDSTNPSVTSFTKGKTINPPHMKHPTRNKPYSIPDYIDEDLKKSKMFKLAAHKLQ